MKDAAILWWDGRSPREQILLGVLGVLLAATLIWLLVIRPIGPALSAAESRHDAAVDTLANTHAQAAALEYLRKNPPPALGAPIAEIVKQAAAETGFQLSRADPVGGDGVIISIISAKPPAFFDWAFGLQRRGIFVDQISIHANPDATIGIDAQLRARTS